MIPAVVAKTFKAEGAVQAALLWRASARSSLEKATQHYQTETGVELEQAGGELPPEFASVMEQLDGWDHQ